MRDEAVNLKTVSVNLAKKNTCIKRTHPIYVHTCARVYRAGPPWPPSPSVHTHTASSWRACTKDCANAVDVVAVVVAVASVAAAAGGVSAADDAAIIISVVVVAVAVAYLKGEGEVVWDKGTTVLLSEPFLHAALSIGSEEESGR